MKNNLHLKRLHYYLLLIFCVLMGVQESKAQGPNAPEAAAFEPVDATDMVNLSSGDVSYVLPLMDMDGFPLTLSYHAGVPLDMESSWAGLGWNINAGAISRSISGTPDDWKSGNSLDFIYFSKTETLYSINVGVGFSNAAEVGVGMSWGSNKSLSGSVYGSVAGFTASIDTNGSYSVGFSAGFGGKNGSYGGGLSISGNVNGGGIGIGVGVGARSSNGATASLGYSLSDSGGSFSLSGGYGKGTGKSAVAGSGGVSIGNYSAGDYDVSSKGFYIPINLGFFRFGFGKRKTKYSLDKGYPKVGYGSLYSKDAVMNTADNDLNGDFNDLQNRYYYTDIYEQGIPSTEEEFITDYDAEREKVNFSFVSYDSYSVNATGISGFIQPKLFDNATLFGQGYAGADSDNSNRKMRLYYHNTGVTSKTFGETINESSNEFRFYFDGQFTNNITIPERTLNTVQSNTFSDYLSTNTRNDISHQLANYIEVYTNSQLVNDQNLSGLNLIKPDNIDYSVLPQDGIGAYMITTPDGKTYHYSLPVYHFEQVERTIIDNSSEKNVNEKRQYSPYATHWLLIAITGPDYVDANNNNKADADDYGYWVKMDYGKWSDGYVWRTPYIGKKYNTNLAGEIEKKDFGNYQFGRKQLYYLDKIETREHTAYFVKDIRYDNTGANGYAYETGVGRLKDVYRYIFSGTNEVENVVEGGTEWVKEEIDYKREYQLYLDKIIVVKNNGEDAISKDVNSLASLDPNGCFPGYEDDQTWTPGYYNNGNISGGFYKEYGNTSYEIHQEQNVYDITDFTDYNYANAVKVIDFSYSYELAKNTPSALYCNGFGGGKLTLKSVHFNGKENFSYMPPYRFSYKNEMQYPKELLYNRFSSANTYLPGQAKDAWGFIDEKQVAEKIYSSTDYTKYGPDNWSLNQIQTPTGGKIKIEYEEDDYDQEAFSRKFWQDNLQFAIERVNKPQGCGLNFGSNLGPCNYRVSVKNINNLNSELITNFKDYFEIGQKVYLDLWIGVANNPNSDFSGETHHSFLNLPGNGLKINELDLDYNTYYRRFFLPNDKITTNITVLDITDDNVLILDLGWYNFEHKIEGQTHSKAKEIIGLYDGSNVGPYFGKDGTGSNVYESKLRGQFPNDLNGGGFRHTMSYKLLANKVPKDVKGGGLRAKSIIVSDGDGREFKTNYYYNKPGTPRDKNDPDYVSSGITSFAPDTGIKFIPYQPELPSPGVMYEYVTMVPVSSEGKELGYTRYRFHTLDPVFNIFNPDIKMEYTSEKVNQETGLVEDEDITIFESKVTDHSTGNDGYFDPNDKTYAKTIDLKINTTLVGQFRSIETFNVADQLLTKSQKFYENTYESGQPTKVIPGRGAIKESFQSMKSIFSTNSSDNDPILKKRLLSISSKENFPSILKQTRTLSGGHTDIEIYEDADPITGAFRTTLYTKPDGTMVRTRNVPAYTQYSEMGSKTLQRDYKNMLTQNTMTISDVKIGASWKTTAASVNTWSSQTKYNDAISLVEDGVWRKHKAFIWKDDVDNDGTYGFEINPHNFNWGYADTQNSKWQKISETTRYNHWSTPLEVKDINNNHLTTKTGDKETKIFATGNTSYGELFYSGAEDLDQGSDFFGGQVFKGSASLSTDAHTGKYALAINTGQNGYEVTVKNAEATNYKISLWVKATSYENTRIKVGSASAVTYNENEVVRAGDWVMLNFYTTISNNQKVHVTAQGANIIVDDFRLCPVVSSMVSYVYNEWDELSHILGANNLATEYRYDDAGRLIETLSEVIDFDVDKSGIIEADEKGSGGFKTISKNKYSYKY